MITSREDTGEGSGPVKVSTEKGKKQGAGIYLLPVLAALPLTGLLAFALIRFGPVIRKLIGIVIKLAVTA